MRTAMLAAIVVLSTLAPVAAEDLLETYVAELGPQDHFNSRGQRLTQAWQVIRQDRANYHRFGKRDPLDEPDSFFASAENRATAERMLRRGGIDRQLADDIVNGNVVVRVEIWGRGATGTSLQVYAY